jgi:hypothetical protein
MAKVVVAAVVVGAFAAFGCLLWRESYAERRLSVADQNLDRAVEDMGLPNAFRREPIPEPAPPWPAQHPISSGILAALAVIAVGRLVEWGRNVEAAAHALRQRRE